MNWPDISHLRCWLDRSTIIAPHRRREEDPKRIPSTHAKESHPSSQDSSSSRHPTARSDIPCHPDSQPTHRLPTTGSDPEVPTIRPVPALQQPRISSSHVSKLSCILVLFRNILLTVRKIAKVYKAWEVRSISVPKFEIIQRKFQGRF